MAYLSRYTHRIGISRLLSMANGKIIFRWRDYSHGYQTRTMTLEVDEFLRRFLLHVPPSSFVRIRYFGILANRQRKVLLNLCRQYLQASLPRQVTTGVANANLCQHCRRGIMRVMEVLCPTRLCTCLANAPQLENSSRLEFASLGLYHCRFRLFQPGQQCVPSAHAWLDMSFVSCVTRSPEVAATTVLARITASRPPP